MDEKRVIGYLNDLCAEADRHANPDMVNSLPGMVKHYYANVFKLRVMTPEGWMRDFPGAAQAVMNGLLEADDKEQLRQRVAALEALIASLSNGHNPAVTAGEPGCDAGVEWLAQKDNS
jgi:hypothetical protein